MSHFVALCCCFIYLHWVWCLFPINLSIPTCPKSFQKPTRELELSLYLTVGFLVPNNYWILQIKCVHIKQICCKWKRLKLCHKEIYLRGRASGRWLAHLISLFITTENSQSLLQIHLFTMNGAAHPSHFQTDCIRKCCLAPKISPDIGKILKWLGEWQAGMEWDTFLQHDPLWFFAGLLSV